MSKYLFTSDIHLTDKPSEQYRWDIFDWLKINAENRGIDIIFILGDLLDQKDHHRNWFVNEAARRLHELSFYVKHIHIIKGNHDYTDPEEPALAFLTKSSKITYWVNPGATSYQDDDFLFIPNTRTFKHEHDYSQYDFVFLHQTFDGAQGANGFVLEGISTKGFAPGPTYIAGDIHVPQKIGPITYCGSPHHTVFGETFDPRVLFWDDNSLKSIPRTSIRKRVIELTLGEFIEAKLANEGDHVRFKITVPEHRLNEWESTRRDVINFAAAEGWVLCGIELVTAARTKFKGRAPVGRTTTAVFESFCTAQRLSPRQRRTGSQLLQELDAQSQTHSD